MSHGGRWLGVLERKAAISLGISSVLLNDGRAMFEDAEEFDVSLPAV